MPTPNLAIPHIAASQNQKEVTANDAFDALDEAMNGTASIDCSAGSTSVDSTTFTRNFELVLSGTPATAFTLTVPDSKRFFLVTNATARVATIQRSSGGGSVDLAAGQRRLLYGTGTGLLAAAPEAAVTGGGFRGALVNLTAAEPVPTSTDTVLAWDAAVYDTDGFWSASNPTRLTVPAGVSRVRLKGNVHWDSGGTGYRHIWAHRNGALFPGAGRESDEGDSGVQNFACAVVPVVAGDSFELIALQTSGSTMNVLAADDSWFAIEVVD
ncbi:MAG: hypothetical protein KatS3mg082_2822 [Nitrospiraceae bacterium]|nr:MAG: hypothetical protein KatS3mg082_2822 [Nitrospiraceae bacterium]